MFDIMETGRCTTLVAALALLFSGPVRARVPAISERFKVRSIEVDDTTNGTVVLEQLLIMDPVIQRSRMVADGQLVNGHMEQIVRCDGKDSSENGYFLDIEGPSATQTQCVNMSRTCTPFSTFWDFPANISDLGKSALPPGTTWPHSGTDFNKFEYWEENERYELYTSTAETGTVRNSNATDTPVWMGKVSIADPAHHLWHFEYRSFQAGEAPAEDYAPPAGIVCPPQQESRPARDFPKFALRL